MRRVMSATSLMMCAMMTACCERTPIMNVGGTYVPAWMNCLLIAVLLCLGLRAALLRMDKQSAIEPAAVFYASFTLMAACIVWLLFYR